MKTRAKSALAGLGVLLMAGTLTACGSDPEPEAPSASTTYSGSGYSPADFYSSEQEAEMLRVLVALEETWQITPPGDRMNLCAMWDRDPDYSRERFVHYFSGEGGQQAITTLGEDLTGITVEYYFVDKCGLR